MSNTENIFEGDNSEWFMRIDDGDIYGPVDISTLKEWSEQGRIQPENEISQDQQNWILAEELPELEMDWLTELSDESIFGPFNIHLLDELISRGVLSEQSILKNRKTGETYPPSPENETINEEEITDQSDFQENTEETKTEDFSIEDSEEMGEIANPKPKTSPFADPRLPHERPEITETTPTHSRATQELEHDTTVDELIKERANVTILQENIQKLQSELNNSNVDKENSESERLDIQSRLTESQSEAENLKAQLTQLQEHYERLQEENQQQFEEIDQLRAETIELEQEYKKKVAQESNRAAKKTSLLAKTLHLIKQDSDLAKGNIPHETEGEDKHDQTKELQLRVGQLQAQVESERKLNRQIDTLLNSSNNNRPKHVADIILAIIVLILSIILVFTTRANRNLIKATEHITQTTISEQANTTVKPLPKPNTQKASNIKNSTNSNNQHLGIPLPSSTNLDLPPEDNADKVVNSQTVAVNWPSISLPRARIFHNNRAFRIVFSYGIFSEYTKLTPEAELDLEKLGKQLKGSIDNFTLIVAGHTDSAPISSTAKHVDNYALGMARAVEVKKYLETKCNLPAARIRTVSAGENDPPYPNNTTQSSRKNRTVILTLIPPPK